MSDTPRTDAATSARMGGESTAYHEYHMMVNLSRTLERELNETKAERDLLTLKLMERNAELNETKRQSKTVENNMHAVLDKLCSERDQWRAVAEQLANAHLALDLGADSQAALAAYEKLKGTP